MITEAEVSRESRGSSSGPQAGGFKTPEESVFQLESKGRKQPMSQLRLLRQEELPRPHRRVPALGSIQAFT